jgi:asparagine synthase (glutamine-hydrolysing)
MCGIAGYISSRFSGLELKSMSDAIAHRGPDAEGFYHDEKSFVGLAHRRLSIIDLSGAANQPFHSSCGRYVMVFNGEVYNFQEIAAKLSPFERKTSSDTEVILEAFKQLGPSCANLFNGMFALAIWDIEKKHLFLLRDRLGIKPLYVYLHENDFAFSSELKSLKKLPIKKEYNKQAVAAYLRLGYIPGHTTAYQNITPFPAGHFGFYKDGKLTSEPYWEISERIKPSVISDEQEAKEQLKGLLLSSVKYRLIADVPVGCFLSGGTDSSLVAALAQQVGGKPIHTFSIGFDEAKFNESQHAKKVAESIGTKHTEYILSEKDALDLIPGLHQWYDQPYADSSAIPTMLVSKLARKDVTVALSGDGGDELFLGYGMYTWAKRLSENKWWHPLAAELLPFGPSKYRRAAELFRQSQTHPRAQLFSQEQYLFSERELAEIIFDETKNITADLPQENWHTSRILNAEEAQALYDIHQYLKDDLLVKVDVASMRYALEIRVPLLDYRVAEFAENLDPALKRKNGVDKYLLKQVLYDYVPNEIMERPKWGFAVPISRWLSKELKPLMLEYTSVEMCKRHGFVKAEKIQRLVKKYLDGEEWLYNRIWVVMQLHLWAEDDV